MNQHGRWRDLLVLLLNCLVLWSGEVMAADKVLDVRPQGQGVVSLTEYFAILEDPSQTWTLADVQTPDVAGRFVSGRPPAESLNYGRTRSAYWLRLTLRNASDQSVRRMLEIGFPLLSHIEFYQPAADGRYQVVVTGAAEPFATRPYPNRFFVFPLTLSAHSEQVMYLRIRSTITMQIPAKLWEPAAFHAWEREDYVTQSWYFGMVVALILFNGLLFVALRDGTYVFYVAFAICMALTVSAGNGWGKEFIWPDTTGWSDIAVSVLGAFAQASLLAFMRRLLGTRELVPRLDWLVLAFIATHLLLAIGFVISIQAFTAPSARVVAATMVLVMFVGGYCAWVKRQRIGVFFVLAFSFWFFGNVVVGLRGYGVLQPNAFTMNGWQIGSVSEMLLLAFALAYRFNLIRSQAKEDVERANASLAQRLHEREAELTRSHDMLREVERQQTLSTERQRLMQDMHDGLGSSLTSALRIAERGQLGAAEMKGVLQGCIDDLRLAIDSMEPLDADLLLLLATLRFRLGPGMEAAGIVLHWEVQELPAIDWLTPKNALHILRILQESFTNIIKHAHATDIHVRTGVQGDAVVVSLTDNGRGFAVEQALAGAGKGLDNQRRRAQAIGAAVAWESGGGGTRFTLTLPLQRPVDEPANAGAGVEGVSSAA